MNLDQLGKRAKQAKKILGILDEQRKNQGLIAMSKALEENMDQILACNEIDIKKAKQNNMKASLVDRLTLNKKRILDMSKGLADIATLKDPIHEQMEQIKRPNGLIIDKVRVPIGVIGIIYEARPNVTSDAAGLCFKTGNAVILRGGKEAFHTNLKVVELLNQALSKESFPEGCIQLIEDTSRETALKMMKLNQFIDLLIPRGGTSLIQSVIKNATIPVIETGVGNCHVYVDDHANVQMGVAIAVNAKINRPSVCNAAETLLVHQDIAKTFFPLFEKEMCEKGVELRGCKKTKQFLPNIKDATEEDWSKEYLDKIMAVKVVENLDQAIEHIHTYGTLHSEAIVTQSKEHSDEFTHRIDAAAVYVNASTRFTDGGEFGFGAEIGISTQKLHARGPMGLKELTSYKYVIHGDGQIR